MLGRGLESLIPPQHQQPDETPANVDAGFASRDVATNDSETAARQLIAGPVFHIEVEKIKSNPYQPRKVFEEVALRELAASIAEHGILQPLVVSKIEHATEFGTEVEYQLIAGERRLLAAKMVGIPRVPVIVRHVPEEREKLELAIIENLQRANLNAIETARAYAKLQDQFGLTQREVATRLGKSREVVANAMRLLGLPTTIQEALAKNQISESQGRLLLAIADPMQQQTLFDDILRNNLSVRELKSRIGRLRGTSASGERSADGAAMPPELMETRKKLEEFFGTNVQLQTRGNKGQIMIDFYSPNDLQNIVQKLLPNQPSPPPSSSLPDEFTV